MVEIIVRSNEQSEAPKNAKLTKTEVSNNVDYSLDTIDEQKFQEFKKMTDYIKENGGEYKDEYEDIMNKVIKPFEEKIQSILDKNKETRDLDSLSNEEVNNIANEIMKNHPKKLMEQQKIIRKINYSGSPEEIQQLNEMINENMADVQNFYEKIMNNMNGDTTPGAEELGPTSNQGEGGNEGFQGGGNIGELDGQTSSLGGGREL